MSNAILALIEQRLKDKIASDMERTKMYVQRELEGRAVSFFWNDPLSKDDRPLKLTGEIATAGFDAKKNITVLIKFQHPTDGSPMTAPRYLSELR